MKKTQTARQAGEFIIGTLREAGHVALFAGGCVRDQLLGAEPKDFDVVTDARPERVLGLFRRTEQVGAKFGVVLVRVCGHQVEVATFRADGDYSDGRHPDSVTFGNEIDDARRRDFTINGMFYDVESQRVIDHVGGRRDLNDKLIRAIGDPDRRFREDHLRMLRAVRFAARLGFTIEPATLAAVKRQASHLRTISAERVREELGMILTSPTRAEGWRWIIEANLTDHLVPGIAFSDVEARTVGDRLAALPDRARFRLALAALLRSLAPPAAAGACRRLTCPNVESRAVGWLLSELPRARAPQCLELADVKMLRADAHFDDLCALLRADLVVSKSPLDAYHVLIERAGAIPGAEVAPPPLITGEDLLARKVPQGPIYAEILRSVYRAQLNKEVHDRAEALARLESLLAAR